MQIEIDKLREIITTAIFNRGEDLFNSGKV